MRARGALELNGVAGLVAKQFMTVIEGDSKSTVAAGASVTLSNCDLQYDMLFLAFSSDGDFVFENVRLMNDDGTVWGTLDGGLAPSGSLGLVLSEPRAGAAAQQTVYTKTDGVVVSSAPGFPTAQFNGPGRPGVVKRHSRFRVGVHFVWRFCMGAQGA